MTKEVKAALEALRQAMGVEQQGREFYLAAEQWTKDSNGKRLFRSIAADEEQHLHLIQVEYQRLSQGQTWASAEEAKGEKPSGEVLVLFPPAKELANLITPDTTDLQALDLAIDFEGKGYQMYGEMEAKTQDTTGQAVYRYLAQQESKHQEVLQRTRDYLASNGMWLFEEFERPIFEG